MNESITLVITVYNKEKYIEATLTSVLNQSFQDFYLLIIDDHSSDNSIKVIQSFFETHPRQYELIQSNENKGIGYTRHFAEQYVNSKYLMFLDADDILYENAIEEMYNTITSDKDLMAVGCYLEYINGAGEKMGGGLFLGETKKEDFIKKASKAKLIFMQPTAIYNREISLSVGGFSIEGYPEGKPRYQDYCEDLDLWTRMSDLYVDGKAIVVIPKILCQYRKINGLSSNSFNMILKMKYVKQNLIRRRNGEIELSFISFLNQLTNNEKEKIRKEAKAADALRECVDNFRKRNIFKGFQLLIISITNKPQYIFEKLKYNFIKRWIKR